MSQYEGYGFDPSQWGYHPQQPNGAPQWPPQPPTNASPASQQTGFPSPLQLPTLNLAGAPGSEDAAARRGSAASDLLATGGQAEENAAGGTASPNPGAAATVGDASTSGPSAAAAGAGGHTLPSVPADLFTHIMHQQQHPQHFQPHQPYYPPHLAAQYGLPNPPPYHLMHQQQMAQAAAAAQQRAAAAQQSGGGTPVLGQGENGAGSEVKVEDGEGKTGEYTPQDPYINSLRASTSSASPSGSASPALPSTSSSAGAPPFPNFPSSLPATLAAYTGLSRGASPYGLNGMGISGMDPYTAATHLSGPPPPQHPHQQQQHPLAHLQQPNPFPQQHQPSPQPPHLQPGQAAAGYKEGTPPDLPYASDDSADEDFGSSGAGAGAKGKGRASRGRARARKDSNNNTPTAVTPSGFAVPRPAGSSVIGADEDGDGPGTRDGSVDSSQGSGSRSRKRPAPESGGGTPLSVGVGGGGDADAEGSDVDPAVLAGLEPGQRLPGQGFAPPRARRQTEIPAVEDDPSVRPYGCNYCAPAGVALPSTVGQQNSWRTIKELREHHTAAHKERQRQLEEAGDEAVMMEMPFRCALDPCGKTFKSLAGLRFHFQNASANGHFFVHLERDEDTGEERATKKFKQEVKPSGRELGCPVGRCPKRFKQSAGLAYHLSHTANHPITLSMLSTFEPTLQSKTKWWFNRLGKEFAPEPGTAPAPVVAAATPPPPQDVYAQQQQQQQDVYAQQQQQQQQQGYAPPAAGEEGQAE